MSAMMEKMEPLTRLRSEWMLVTPRIAAEWLKHANPNRKIKKTRVTQYAADMTAGQWRATGDAIRFNLNGRLDDGNHRLLACIESGASFTTLVIWGIDDAAHSVLDTGAPRSLADILQWKEEVSPNELAAAISNCWRFEQGVFRQPNQRPTVQQALRWLDDNPRIRESVRVSGSVRRHAKLIRTAVSIVHYETSRIALADAELFFHSLIEGTGLESGSPVLALRRWADANAAKRERPGLVIQTALILKACNYWRQGKTIDFLYWRGGGAKAELFPTVWVTEDEGDLSWQG